VSVPRHPALQVKSKQKWQLAATSVFRHEVEKTLRDSGFGGDAHQFIEETESCRDSLSHLTEIAALYVTVIGRTPKRPKETSAQFVPKLDTHERGTEGSSATDLDRLIQQSRKERGVVTRTGSAEFSEDTSLLPASSHGLNSAETTDIEISLAGLPIEARAPFKLLTELLNDAHLHIRVPEKRTLALFYNLTTSQIGTTTRTSGSASSEYNTTTRNNKTTWNESSSTRPDFLTVRNWFVAFTTASSLVCLTTNGAQLQDGSSEIVQMIEVGLDDIYSVQWGYQEGWDVRMASANRVLNWLKSHPVARSVIENISRQPWNLERIVNININFGEVRIASPMIETGKNIAEALEGGTFRSESDQDA